jgi:hypothetical protein
MEVNFSDCCTVKMRMITTYFQNPWVSGLPLLPAILNTKERIEQFGPEPPVFSSAAENLKIRICNSVIFPLVLYGYETWSLTLRENID